ncbi:MAG: hypothetical protein M3N02_09695 [Pseudomonadota bacterium]|nr:hypothetical protein [Pseudomonadota bacterium]
MTETISRPSDDHGAKPPTLSGDPERELELKLKKNPDDKQAKADLGSDQSMDASDPSSATQPGGNDPVPSSQFPE